MNNKLIMLFALVLAAAGGALAAKLFGHHEPAAAAAAATPQPRKPLYWYDPMKPDQHFDKPGHSPFMDMELEPKYADEAAAPGTVSIDPRMAQNLGIRLAAVERASVTAQLRAPGAITPDDTRIEAVQTRAAGWVEQLAVRAAGDPVRRGQLLAQLYAPDLLAAQEELLLALRAQDGALAQSARARLELLGVDAAQIARIEKTGKATPRISVYSPVDGVVQELGVRLGQQLMPGATLYTLADLSTVWLAAEVPEAQAAAIHTGDTAAVRVSSLPGESFSGRVDYLYPDLSAQTRTLRVRVVLHNPAMKLRPGMYATAEFSGAAHEALLVPSEALIRTGTRSVLIIADDDSHYHPVDVVAGAESGGRTEIISGVDEGAQVVASGQFLIDSEANLNSALKRVEGEPK